MGGERVFWGVNAVRRFLGIVGEVLWWILVLLALGTLLLPVAILLRVMADSLFW